MRKLNISFSRNPNGFLYAQIYFGGAKALFSVGIKVSPNEWNGKPKGRRANELQRKLDKLKADLQRDFEYLKAKAEYEGTILSPQELKDFHLNKHTNTPQKPSKSILDIMQELTEIKALEGNLKPQSVVRKQTQMNNIKKYLEHIGKPKITFEEVNFQFIEDLINFIRVSNFTSKKEQKPKKNTYLKKYRQFLKEANEYALMKEYCKKIIPNYRKLKNDADATPFLMRNELTDLMNLDLSKHNDTELSKVRDLFVFMAHTGFLWSDCQAFNPKEHITLSNNSEQVIVKPREKTNSLQTLRLFPEAKAILEKYGYSLPLGTEQIYNKKIKILCEMIGVPNAKAIKIRSGRKTAGMVWLNSGIRLEVVSKMLGHKNIATTQRHYASILNETILSETAHLVTNSQNLKINLVNETEKKLFQAIDELITQKLGQQKSPQTGL
jgi:integrase